MSKPAFRTPTDLILRAVKAVLDAFDWQAAGLEEQLHIRHARRRFSTPDEFPCLTIRWEQDEPRQADQEQSYLTADEMAVEMRITLEVETETLQEDNAPPQDEDDTGLGYASAIAALAMRALRDPEGALLQLWADSVSDRGRAEDPESKPDEARYEQSVIVLYRVLERDPSVLLARGVNA